MPLLYQQRLANAAAEREQAAQDAALRRALALQAFGGAPGADGLDPMQPVPALAGVTDATSPQAGLSAELANDQLEQQRQAALPTLAATVQNAALTRAGLDPMKMAQARLETLRGNLLADNAASLTPAARVNAANKQDVSPVRSEGGVFYNRFNERVPFIGMSEPAAARADASWAAANASKASAGASAARARLYGTQASEADLRLNALRGVLEQGGVNPLVAADVANSKAVSKPQRVKVKGQNGDTYYDATRRPDGGFDYTPVTDAGGKPLQVPASDQTRQTAVQTNTAYVAKTLGIPETEALAIVLRIAGRTDAQLSESIGARLAANPLGRYANDPKGLTKAVQSAVTAIRAAAPPPVTSPAPAAPAPAPAATPAPAAATAGPPAAYPQARRGLDGGWYIPDPTRPGKYRRIID